MILSLLLLALPSQAGSRWLQNDGWTDGAKAAFQGGFVSGECWGSIYVPSSGDYPFSLQKVRMLVGGSSASQVFTIAFYNLPAETFSGTYLGAEGVYIAGSSSAWNELTVAELKLDMPDITSGNVGVSVCFEEHSGYPAISRDVDGTINNSRNYIYSSGTWLPSYLYGLSGDWIMRLCIDGDGVSDEGCSDIGTGDGGATDGGATDGGSGDGGDGGGGDGGATGDGGTTGDGGDGGTTGDGGAELAIISITPSEALEGEALDVVVLGEGFSESAQARIGGIALVGNSVVGETTISGRTPTTLPVGVHDVEVVEGSESVVIPGGFEVLEAEEKGGCSCASARAPGAAGVFGLVLGLIAVRRRRSGVVRA